MISRKGAKAQRNTGRFEKAWRLRGLAREYQRHDALSITAKPFTTEPCPKRPS